MAGSRGETIADFAVPRQARLDSAELSQAVPTSYSADLVVLLVDSLPVLGIVVEVQLKRDERKRMTWPAYVANLRARIECPTELLVVARTTPWRAGPQPRFTSVDSRRWFLSSSAPPAVLRLNSEKLVLYTDLIEYALGEAARKAFEMYFPKGYELQTETGRRLARAVEQGRAEGRSEGRSASPRFARHGRAQSS